MTDLIAQYLLQGDLIGFVQAIYLEKMGEYFFGVLMVLLSLPLYIRTQSLTYVMALWLVCSPLLLYFVPVAGERVLGTLAILALGGLLFLVFRRRT